MTLHPLMIWEDLGRSCKEIYSPTFDHNKEKIIDWSDRLFVNLGTKFFTHKINIHL